MKFTGRMLMPVNFDNNVHCTVRKLFRLSSCCCSKGSAVVEITFLQPKIDYFDNFRTVHTPGTTGQHSKFNSAGLQTAQFNLIFFIYIVSATVVMQMTLGRHYNSTSIQQMRAANWRAKYINTYIILYTINA